MICAIHQPQFLPWLGYFDKIDKSDIFVFLDNVQYKKNEWQNRNRIKIAHGWQWLTIPVKYRFGQRINEILIDYSKDWRPKHWQALITNYQKSPYFKDYRDFFQKVYQQNWRYLAEINIYLIRKLMKFLGIEKEMKKASDLGIKGEKTIRLVEICKVLGADTYLSGQGAKDYLDLEKFKRAKIEVIFQEFAHPIYRQNYQGFEPNLSIIDLLFNEGKKSLSLLRGRAKKDKNV
ncbi:MAG: WbqC family protein [Candidatus Omnitrophica bacterium]|nr:WbqC family protein [Candidatus Omnitrophota bacterium]